MNFRFIITLFVSLMVLGCSSNSDDGTDDIHVDKSANLKASGTSANDILSNDNFNKLHIEIGYVSGYKPTTTAISDLETYIKQHSFKEDIEITYLELDSFGKDEITLDEIFDLEKENRTAYNDGSTLSIYIYFADASSDEDVEEEDLVTLGAVYFNTSMVIYEETIRTLAARSNLISVADIEAATLNHELGHLLGLVNLNTTSVNDHEGETTDEDGNIIGDNHCTIEGCLMRAELQFTSVSGKNNLTSKSLNAIHAGCKLSGNSVLNILKKSVTSKGLTSAPDLDAECILDLQANGGR